MSPLSKYQEKPKATLTGLVHKGRYEPYNLRENPFPAFPSVNQESGDPRLNGEIYDPFIRRNELDRMKHNFLTVPQSNLNHLRLGYIIDTSYVGRGNGKSSFLIYLQKEINRDFCLAISGGLNKCFAVIAQPEPGGRTKTFENFVDALVESILKTNIINDTLATLRLQAILALYPNFDVESQFINEEDVSQKLNSEQWFMENRQQIDLAKVHAQILSSPLLQNLPVDFPLFRQQSLLFAIGPLDQTSFADYYYHLKRGKPKLEFVFSHLVNFFLAANFNGAYVFVDDFERIPDFQSDRQKRDFALELRTCLFDGLYTGAKVGFYNLILALHAGVPRAVQKAWDESGLERRAPVSSYRGLPNHVIAFDKITNEHARRLIRTYLDAYRINPNGVDPTAPFTTEAIARIASLSQFNAAEILKKANELLERAVDKGVLQIDASFVQSSDEAVSLEQKVSVGIDTTGTKNLYEIAQ